MTGRSLFVEGASADVLFQSKRSISYSTITGTHAVCFALSARFLSPLTPNFDHLRPKTNCSLRGDEPLLRRPSRLSSLPDPEPSAAAGRLAAENCAGGGGGGGIPGGSARRRRFDCATDEATDDATDDAAVDCESWRSTPFARPDAISATVDAETRPIGTSSTRESTRDVEARLRKGASPAAGG